MKRTLIKNTIQRQGKKVLIKGWVTAVREHGGVNFLDVRDWTGTIQAVLRPENNNNNNNNGNGNGLKKRGYQSSIISHQSPALPAEWDVVEISGEIAKRPEKMVNPNLPTGQIELKVSSLKILSQAKPSPIPLNTEGYEVAEEKRLKYRYLDLRRPRLQENLKTRQQVKQAASEFLINQGFLEVTTPLLTKSTPEGARDFVVPSRLQPGKFYALPQSPQQYKQLLMVSGIEKYFQFPEVFRDEDLRADRLLEHTQLDIEMAFASQKAILDLVEQLVIYITQEVLGKKIKERVPRPNQTAQGPGRFPRLPYQQAIEKYKTDRPDLRTAQEKKDKRIMAYVWITDFPMFEKLEDGSLSAVHHPFTKIQPLTNDSEVNAAEELIQFFEKNKNRPSEILKLKAHQYDLVLNGTEVAGGSIREHRPKILQKVFEALGHSQQQIKQKFGHLLEAFSYGAPPHGGIAFGFDRWLATLLAEPSIREVVAFPTTGQGMTAVMEAPAEISKEQLKELGLQIKKPRSH